MEKVVFDWLMKNYPVIFLCLAVAAVVWIIAKFYFRRFKKMEETVGGLPCGRHEEDIRRLAKTEETVKDLPCGRHEEDIRRLAKTEETVKDLPCGRHEEDIRRLAKTEETVKDLPCGRHEDNFRAIEDSFRSVNEKLTKIITILTVKYPSSAAAFSAKRSPRQLNEMGDRLYNACGGRELLERNSELFVGMISDGSPKTALDVENKAYEVLSVNRDLDIFNPVKQWVYESPSWDIDSGNGTEQHAITMDDVCFVISIPLRDLYLSRHPEIQPDEQSCEPLGV